MQRVALVNPRMDVESQKSPVHPPAGLMCLAAVAKSVGVDVDILDVEANSDRELLRYIEKVLPDIIGFTCTSATFARMLYLAKIVRRIYPSSKVIVGGPHASFVSKNEFALLKDVDVIVRGEGEIPFSKLVSMQRWNKKTLLNVPAIMFKHNNKIYATRPARVITPELSLSLFTERVVDYSKYCALPLITSRGCPFDCAFCVVPALSLRTFRIRKICYIRKDIENAMSLSRKIEFFKLVDDVATLDKKHFMEVLKLLSDSGIGFTFDTRIDLVDEDILKSAREAGCLEIFFGVESGSEVTLSKIGKGYSKERIIPAIVMTRKAEIPSVVCNFMIGFPWERKEDILDTIELAQILRHRYEAKVTCSFVMPFPGSKISKKFNLDRPSYDWDFRKPFTPTKYLSIDDLLNLYLEFASRVA